MMGAADPFDELGRLIAALCDDEITPQQAARLEQLAGRSEEARRYFLQYIELHGELYWAGAASAPVHHAAEPGPLVESQVPGVAPGGTARVYGRAALSSKIAVWLVTIAAAALVVIVGWWSVPRRGDDPGGRPSPDFVARVSRTVGAVWADGQAVPTDGTKLAAGRKLRLEQGLVQLAFRTGASVILEGPAECETVNAHCGALTSGLLVAAVPAEAAGFVIRTPGAVIVDQGTEFGLAVEEDGASQVHVFAGAVEVQTAGAAGDSGMRRLVGAGQAVSVPVPEVASQPRIRQIALASGRFVRALPPRRLPAGSVADLRKLVACHPNLIHHYTFEGTTRSEKRRDHQGDLHLDEVVMADGRGAGQLDYMAEGVDRTTDAVRPLRAPRDGNTSGLAFQSETRFHPPEAMTVELLLSFDGPIGQAENTICCAVATRDDQKNCGFLVAAVAEGRLVHLMDADAPWVTGDFTLNPGEWYYLASTFRTESEQTIVNSYVANLTRRERTLSWVIKDEAAPGVPAPSRLGIGKGFDRDIAHAYAWAGALDEVAIYDAVLDRATLQKHLEALLEAPDSLP